MNSNIDVRSFAKLDVSQETLPLCDILLIEDNEPLHIKSKTEEQSNDFFDPLNEIARSCTPKGRRELLQLQKQVSSSEVLTSYIDDVSDTKLRKVRKSTKDESNELSKQKSALNRSKSFYKMRRDSAFFNIGSSSEDKLNNSLQRNCGNDFNKSESENNSNTLYRSKSFSKSPCVLPSIDDNSSDWSADEKSKRRLNMRSQNLDFVQKQKAFLNRICNATDEKSETDEDRSINESKSSETSPCDLKFERIWTEPPKMGWDSFCWKCADSGGMISCTECVRSYHIKCLKSLAPTNLNRPWSCPECTSLEHFIKIRTRGDKPMLSKILLNDLLQFALNRMKRVPGSDEFLSQPDPITYPNYKMFVVKPVTFDTLQENINNKMYKYSEEFAKEVKFLLHNSIILNGNNHRLTTVAKAIIKVSRQETTEIETCSECYFNANTNIKWFVQVCSKPHMLLWAKLKGFPYWPGKAMSVNSSSMSVNVRFFGEHDRAYVSVKDCYLYSQEDPNPNSAKKMHRHVMTSVLEEVDQYVVNLKTKIGFKYAPLRMQYDPSKLSEQLELTMPGYANYITKKNQLEKPPLTYKIVKTAGNNLSIVKKTSEETDNVQKIPLTYEVIIQSECKNNETKISPVLLKRKADTTLEFTKKKKNSSSAPNEGDSSDEATEVPSISQNNSVTIKTQSELISHENDSIKKTKNDNDILPPLIWQTQKSTNNLMTFSESTSKCSDTNTVVKLSDDQLKLFNISSLNTGLSISKVVKVTENSVEKESVKNNEHVFKMNSDKCNSTDAIETNKNKNIDINTESYTNPMINKIDKLIPVNEIKTELVETNSAQDDNCSAIVSTMIPNMTLNSTTTITRTSNLSNCHPNNAGECNGPSPFICVPKPFLIKTEKLDDDCTRNKHSESATGNIRLVGNTTIQSITSKVPGSSENQIKKQKHSTYTQSVGKKHNQRARKSFPNKGKFPVEKKTTQVAFSNSSNVLTNFKNTTNMVYIPYDKATNNLLNPTSLNLFPRSISSTLIPETSTVITIPNTNCVLQSQQSNNINAISKMFTNLTNLTNSSNCFTKTTSTAAVTTTYQQSNNINDISKMFSNLTNLTNSSNCFTRTSSTAAVTTTYQNPIVCSIPNSSVNLSGTANLNISNINDPNYVKANSYFNNPSINIESKISDSNNIRSNVSTPKTSNSAAIITNMVQLPQQLVSTPCVVGKNNGNASKVVMEKANQMTEFFRTLIESTLNDLDDNGNWEAKYKILQLEMEKMKESYEKQIKTFKANADIVIAETRNSVLKDKAIEIANTKKQCEVEKMRLVEEAKKKQWCINCLGEAQFYCCWNTSYCNLDCQQKHWLTHMSTCEQVVSNTNTNKRNSKRFGSPNKSLNVPNSKEIVDGKSEQKTIKYKELISKPSVNTQTHQTNSVSNISSMTGVCAGPNVVGHTSIHFNSSVQSTSPQNSATCNVAPSTVTIVQRYERQW